MILVTGADGIVGRAVCKALHCDLREFLPTVRQRKPRTNPRALVLDLADVRSRSQLEKLNLTHIIHLAAAVPHSAHYPDSEKSAQITRRIDSNILWLQQARDIPVVFMSTCGLYDRKSNATKVEDVRDNIVVESPYFAAKLEAERSFRETGQCTILRLAAPVGVGLKPSVVLSRFVTALQSNRPIQIWGSGLREQNFIDARDVSDLIVRILAVPRPCTMNAAALRPTTMVELAEVVTRAFGKGTFEFPGIPDPRDGETARYSISKAQSLYGWEPRIDLEYSCSLLCNENFEANQ